MAGSADLRVAAAGVRVFTVEEASRVLDPIEAIFREMDPRLLRLRELRELLEDVEQYYGDSLARAPLEERERHQAIWSEAQATTESVNRDVAQINAFGCSVKDSTMGLVDFYGLVDGELVFLCWRRGEPRVGHFHPLHTGFAGRKPLPTAP